MFPIIVAINITDANETESDGSKLFLLCGLSLYGWARDIAGTLTLKKQTVLPCSVAVSNFNKEASWARNKKIAGLVTLCIQFQNLWYISGWN